MPRRPFALAFAVAVATAALTAACGGGSVPTKPGVVRVVAAENFWGDIAKQIGGSHVDVTSLISDPNTDPHLFESNPQAVAEVANAQLVIANGLGYDAFIDKMVAAGGRKDRVVVTLANRLRGLDADSPNPHIWYRTASLPDVAADIGVQLEQIDPADSEVFRAGIRRFAESLAPIVQVSRTIRRKYAGTPVGYTERLPGYLLKETDLKVGSPVSFAQAIEDGNDPSPGDLVKFEDVIKNHQIKVLIYNAQVVDAATERLRRLALASHVAVVGMTETMPGHLTFQGWQLRQDRELLRALGG